MTMEQLATAARAAGFAMATPETIGDDAAASATRHRAIQPAARTTALVITSANAQSGTAATQATWRDWFSAFSGRAPA